MRLLGEARQPTRVNKAHGIAEMLLSGVCFGFLGLFGKAAYRVGIAPGELLALRFLLAGTLMVVYFALREPRRLLVPRATFAVCAALGVCGYAVFSSCYFFALQGISASLTVLLLYLYPALVTVGGIFLLGQRPGKLELLALPVSLAGLLLLVLQDLTVSKGGFIAYGVASAVVYALYILGSARALKGRDPWVAAAYIQLFAGTVLTLLHLRSPARIAEVTLAGWPILLGVALVSTIAAMSLFLSGLQKIRASEASLLSTAEPVTAIFLAQLMLGETLGFLQAAGAALVLLALVLTSLDALKADARAP